MPTHVLIDEEEIEPIREKMAQSVQEYYENELNEEFEMIDS